jgi:hypothetical protein
MLPFPTLVANAHAAAAAHIDAGAANAPIQGRSKAAKKESFLP